MQLEKTTLLSIFEFIFKQHEETIGSKSIFVPYEILNEHNVALDDYEEMKHFILNYIENNIASVHINIRIVEARETIARRLSINEGEILLCFYEIMYSEKGIPNIYSKTYCIPRYFDFYINSSKR